MTSLRAASPASALNFPCSPRLASGSLCPLQRRSRETSRSCSISCRGSLRPMRPVTQSCPCLLHSVCPLLQARTCLGPSVFLISLGIWGSVNVTVALPPGASLVGFRTPAETARSRTAYPRPLTLNTRRVTPSPPPPRCPRARCSSPRPRWKLSRLWGWPCIRDPPSYAQGTQGQCGSGVFRGESGNSKVESPCQGSNHT